MADQQPDHLNRPHRISARSLAFDREGAIAVGPNPYIHDTRLDYVVTDLTTTQTVSAHPINTRYGFGGEFFGDYTGLSVGSDGTFHALWTDTNNEQIVEWFCGAHFSPTLIHQQDVATAAGKF